jgi:hypothetical protein
MGYVSADALVWLFVVGVFPEILPVLCPALFSEYCAAYSGVVADDPHRADQTNFSGKSR